MEKRKTFFFICNAFQATVSNLILFAVFFNFFPCAGTISTYCVQTNTGTAYIYLNMQLSKSKPCIHVNMACVNLCFFFTSNVFFQIHVGGKLKERLKLACGWKCRAKKILLRLITSKLLSQTFFLINFILARFPRVLLSRVRFSEWLCLIFQLASTFLLFLA